MTDNPSIRSAYAGTAVDSIGEQPFFSNILDAVEDGIIAVDTDGAIVFANPAMERLLGHEPDDLIHTSFVDLIPELHRDRYASSFETFVGTEAHDLDWSGIRMPLTHADGHHVPAELSFSESETDGTQIFTGIVRDLSKPDGSEEPDEPIDDQLVSLVREVKDYAMFTLGPDGFVRNWNPGAANIKGYEEDEIVGRHFSTFYPEADVRAGVPDRNLDEAVENGRFEQTGWRVRKDGSRFWAKVLITPLWYDDGTLRGFAKITQDITDQREQEERLRHERELLDEILNTTPIAMSVSNAEGETLRANDRAATLLGISKDEILNTPENADEWAVFDSDGNELAPEDQPVARVLATGEPIYNEKMAIQRPDGSRLWISNSIAPMFDENGEIERIVSAGEDITELKRLQRKLERERDTLQAELDEVFGRITEGVFAMNDDWQITYANENMLALVGHSMDEIMGEGLWDVFPEIVGTPFETKYRQAMETQKSITFEAKWEDEEWLEVHAYPSETGLSIYFRDISHRKRQQQELEQAVRKLEASNEKLERFAYVTSHDLQEPLRMVSSYLQLLESRYADELDQDAEEFIEFAVDGAERMRDMIDALLQYSRVSRGDRDYQPVDCDAAAEAALANVRTQIEESGAEITVDELPTVEGDEKHLTQLFQNLFSNAIKYRGDDSPRIDVSVERSGDEWTFAVADNGIGMEPEETDRIFEIFNRLHSNDAYPGTGIGLAICREIVDNHDGEIGVESEPGVGTTFRFTLPA